MPSRTQPRIAPTTPEEAALIRLLTLEERKAALVAAAIKKNERIRRATDGTADSQEEGNRQRQESLQLPSQDVVILHRHGKRRADQ